MLIYIAIFILLLFLALLKPNGKIALYVAMIFLGGICAFRGSDVDRDYNTYISIYSHIIDGYQYAIEPSFYIFSILSNKLVGAPWLIFVFYALLAIFFKVKFIQYWSPFFMLSVIVYYSNIYFLHEMTQIRIGLASSIGFFSLKYLIDNKKKKYYFCVLIAMTIHFSIIAFLFLPLMNLKNISKHFKINYSIALFALYILYQFKVDLTSVIKFIGVDFIQNKYQMYQNQVNENDVRVNVFSAFQLLHIAIIYFAMYHSSKFENDDKFVTMLKIYSLGPISLIAFSTVPGLSLRFSELFSVCEIILLPMLVRQIKQTGVAYFSVITLSFSILIINIYYMLLVKAYAF